MVSLFSKFKKGIKRRVRESNVARAKAREVDRKIQRIANEEFDKERLIQAIKTAKLKARALAEKKRLGIRAALRITRATKTPKAIKRASSNRQADIDFLLRV